MSITQLVGILDIGMGNLASVYNAIYINGHEPMRVSNASQFDDLTHLILPGVGGFNAAVRELNSHQLKKPIEDYVNSGRPLLGSCLGMQLLVTRGEEGGASAGLDLISGGVVRINQENIRVPHVGWNTLNIIKPHPVFQNIKNGCDFYFVHSYYVVCNNENNIICNVEYGHTITAAIGSKNIVGVQFHPEKSQLNGLRLLENFCNWDGKC